MHKKKALVLPLLIAITTIFTLIVFPYLLSDRPTITYFPGHERIRFLKMETQLQSDRDTGTLQLDTFSRTQEKNNLMQNFSLLYRNNQLVSILNHWEKNTAVLSSIKETGLEPGFYEGLTVHQAELHLNESIYGRERYSQDQLMVLKQNGSYSAFRQPSNRQEALAFADYNRRVEQQRTQLLQRVAQNDHIRISDYRVIPLNELTDKTLTKVFPFSEAKAERIAGQLWEGLYKNFVRGIQLTQEQGVQAIGSTLPLLLIAPDHMLIVIRAQSGQMVLLRQNFS